MSTACSEQKNSEREPYPDIQVSKQGKISLLPTAGNLKTLLKNSGIHISYDMLLHRIIVESPDPALDEKFNGSTNGYNNLLVFCADQFVRDGLRVSASKVHEWITALADENKRNAAREYLEKVGADGVLVLKGPQGIGKRPSFVNAAP